MPEKPNVLLINCDDMGYGDLGCYGSTVNHTPTIDALAAEGVRLTSFYAASPVCSPSRAALMTGCYPPRIGITRVLFPGEPFGLDPAEYTLPRMFSENGYATMCIGKWHCGDQPGSLPCDCGFDEYYGLPYSNDMGMQVGKTDFVHNPPLPLLSGSDVIEEQPDQTTLTERYVEQGIRFIRAHAGEEEKPFFLYLAEMHVHLPLYAPHHFVVTSENGDFGACMADVDWSVRALVHELKAQGLYENTIIIFTSDNGSRADHGASNAPLRGTKHTVWEGGQRVPFIFHWKGHTGEGVEVRSMASNIDLLPTLASLIGAELPDGHRPIDGEDVSALLLSDDTPVRQTFCYFHDKNLAAIRVGNWKLHRARGGERVCELYDLENDLSETTDVAAEHPEVVQRLEAEAQNWANRLGDERNGVEGAEKRPCRMVENPRTLTVYDENHPYIIALYDKGDVG